MNVKIEVADITKQHVDAIVNAANEACLGGGGVDGAIHKAAGPALKQECRKLTEVRPGVRCPTGKAVITDAGNLPCKKVIHTVGPDCREVVDESEQDSLLASAYFSALELAKKNGLLSIAFPSISTGIFGFPINRAAKIVAKTVADFLAHEPDMSVTMCIYDGNPKVQAKLLKAYTDAFVEQTVECSCDINIGYFEEIDAKIKTASVAELLAIRKKALADAKEAEKDLLKGESDGEIIWQEDAAIIYEYQMRFVAACSLRLAQKYQELERE